MLGYDSMCHPEDGGSMVR